MAVCNWLLGQHSTLRLPVAFPSEGKSGLSSAEAWMFASGFLDSTRPCGYQWRFSRGKNVALALPPSKIGGAIPHSFYGVLFNCTVRNVRFILYRTVIQ